MNRLASAAPTTCPETRAARSTCSSATKEMTEDNTPVFRDPHLPGPSEFINPSPPSVPWAIWLARIKQAMLFHPERRDAPASAFAADGIRLRPLDDAPVVQGRSSLGRMRELASER